MFATLSRSSFKVSLILDEFGVNGYFHLIEEFKSALFERLSEGEKKRFNLTPRVDIFYPDIVNELSDMECESNLISKIGSRDDDKTVKIEVLDLVVTIINLKFKSYTHNTLPIPVKYSKDDSYLGEYGFLGFSGYLDSAILEMLESKKQDLINHYTFKMDDAPAAWIESIKGLLWLIESNCPQNSTESNVIKPSYIKDDRLFMYSPDQDVFYYPRSGSLSIADRYKYFSVYDHLLSLRKYFIEQRLLLSVPQVGDKRSSDEVASPSPKFAA